MKKLLLSGAVFCFCILMAGCPMTNKESDTEQRKQQAELVNQISDQTGMPNIVNGRERKIMKQIWELRDQDDLVTYTYVFNELKGELIFLGETIGYPIPYATQYTNPDKPLYPNWHDTPTIRQADPNGLFSPESAEGTWILMKDPNSNDVQPVYIEARIICSRFLLNTE